EGAFVARVEPTGIFGVITELIALSNKLDALDQNSALAQALTTRAAGVRQSIISLIAGLNARGNALSQGTGAADVATLKDRKKSFESLLEEHKLASATALPLSKQIVLLGIYTNNVGRWHAAIEQGIQKPRHPHDRAGRRFRADLSRCDGVAMDHQSLRDRHSPPRASDGG